MRTDPLSEFHRHRVTNLCIFRSLTIKYTFPRVACSTDASGRALPLEPAPVREELQPGPFTNREDTWLRIMNIIVRHRSRRYGRPTVAPTGRQNFLRELLSLSILGNLAVLNHVLKLVDDAFGML